jgi:hypothetical protein
VARRTLTATVVVALALAGGCSDDPTTSPRAQQKRDGRATTAYCAELRDGMEQAVARYRERHGPHARPTFRDLAAEGEVDGTATHHITYDPAGEPHAVPDPSTFCGGEVDTPTTR